MGALSGGTDLGELRVLTEPRRDTPSQSCRAAEHNAPVHKGVGEDGVAHPDLREGA